MGAGVVLLDEPTAQLDVRGEAEIFERILTATPRTATTILDLAPLLDRAPSRPHLRPRTRPRRGARKPRRADGGRRPLPHDVRSAGVALRSRRTRRRHPMRPMSPGNSMSSTDPLPPALASMWRAVKRGYRRRAAAARRSLRPRRCSRALPDALLALWLALLGNGMHRQHRQRRSTSPPSVSASSAAATWYPEGRERPHAAPVSRSRDHRARVARGPAAGGDRDDRAPRTARVPRSALRAAQPDLRARSHVHVDLLDVRLDPAPRRSRWRC